MDSVHISTKIDKVSSNSLDATVFEWDFKLKARTTKHIKVEFVESEEELNRFYKIYLKEGEYFYTTSNDWPHDQPSVKHPSLKYFFEILGFKEGYENPDNLFEKECLQIHLIYDYGHDVEYTIYFKEVVTTQDEIGYVMYITYRLV